MVAVAEAIGVTAEPEVLAMELTPNHPFIVLASDGVWEFLTSQDVVDVVSCFGCGLEKRVVCNDLGEAH